MHSSLLSRLAGRSLFALLCAGAVSARAQDDAAALMGDDVQLDRFVVSASRTPQDISLTPSSVSLVDIEEVKAAQIDDLSVALSQQPGVIVLRTGALGGPTSVFLRGANSHQALFLVDGIRMNDRSASYTNFLGAADLGGVGRLEVLRGPQSTLYGSSAMGGLIALETTRGEGPAAGSITATAGSFDTFGASVAVSGEYQKLNYSGSVGRLVTANDAPHNDFEPWSYASRLEFAVTPELHLGATFRGQDVDFEQTGSRLFYAPGVVQSSNYLGTAYAHWERDEFFSSRLTVGVHRRAYTFSDQWGVSNTRNRRYVIDWQNSWQVNPSFEVVAGANYERSRYLVDATRSTDEISAGFLSATWHAREDLTITGGVRHDDFESVGDATTGRVGLSYRPLNGTKLRATYGTGFSAPGSDDRYGVPQWGQVANPHLRPEKSRGWDLGIDQEISDRGTISLTFFQNRFRDLFEWEYVNLATFEGRTANVAKARTQGVELGFQHRITDAITGRVSYTYLDAEDTRTRARLIRRPRHTVDAEIRATPVAEWMIGVGVHGVVDRVERAGPLEDFTTVRLFTSYAVRRDLHLKLRVENALDEEYEEILGYPALSRGVFGAVEWQF